MDLFQNIMGIVIIGVILMLTIHQVVQYYQARLDPDEIPYPRIRLSRRVGIALIFIIITLFALLWNPSSARGALFMVGAILTGLTLAALLFVRDLRETTQTVMQHVENQTQTESQLLADLLRKHPPKDS